MNAGKSAPPVVHLIVQGPYGSVWLLEAANREFEKLTARTDQNGRQAAKTIRRYFDRFAEHGPSRLDSAKMFKPLGKFPDGTGSKVQLFEFKAFQWRLYGVLRDFRGGRAFVGVEVDPDKKKDKADQALLQRCAKTACE